MRLLHRFLALLAFALSPAVGLAAPSQIITGNELHDTRLRLTVTKPDSWRFLTPKEKRDSRKSVTHKNTRWDMMVKQNSFPSRIVIAKYPEPFPGLNPSVAIDVYPLEEYRFKDAMWLASWDISFHRNLLFTPFRVTTGPFMVQLDTKQASYYRAQFELELVKAPPMKIDHRCWIITTALGATIISAGGTQEGPDHCETELAAIIESIRFDK